MPSSPIRDLDILLASLQAERNAGTFVFCAIASGVEATALQPVAMFREREGLTVILEESAAVAAGLHAVFHAAWITLTVHSDLQAVGLTAAVSGALAAAGISANIVAAVHHDHLFVPVDRAADAIAILERLQADAQRKSPQI